MCVGPEIFDLIAYRHHARWGKLNEDIRQMKDDIWMAYVKVSILHPIRTLGEFIVAINSPGYPDAGREGCEICGDRGEIPAPNQMYTAGTDFPWESGRKDLLSPDSRYYATIGAKKSPLSVSPKLPTT